MHTANACVLFLDIINANMGMNYQLVNHSRPQDLFMVNIINTKEQPISVFARLSARQPGLGGKYHCLAEGPRAANYDAALNGLLEVTAAAMEKYQGQFVEPVGEQMPLARGFVDGVRFKKYG